MLPTIENILFLHTVAVEAFGGSEGVRDLESLRAAVARPWGSSFRQDHFPTPFDKAAALAESLIRRHPFVDGNKRTAMYAAVYLLEKLQRRSERLIHPEGRGGFQTRPYGNDLRPPGDRVFRTPL